ncbi:MAG: cysteine--tRNA ligase [Alphaproteobacteria bacterium]|nr:cysteine--tRNA ligase [Alphaproteobacteria bacterium]MDD9919543.1 cysteine--tRNA ligase [Alphaproteobacteria bacterium]
MKLTLTNTLTRKKEEFTPIDDKNVRMYVCGVTPYNYAQLGNARPAVIFDVLFRLLRHMYGENHVSYARNFTDIDDKIIARANELGEDPQALAERYIKAYHEDVEALNCLPPSHEPRATEVVSEIIGMVQTLVDKGIAYVTPTGDVNYDVTKAPKRNDYTYGDLSGKKIDELIAGARVDVDEHKKNAGDFALWKAVKPGEPKWESPWGQGRPGWHIECSAMTKKLFGDHFDIHAGGEDLQFPHHENEIAQSEGECGHKHVNYWMHNAFITVDGRRMGKSMGNFITIKEARTKYSGEAIRLWLLQTHYRKPVDFSEDALAAAENRIKKINKHMMKMFKQSEIRQEVGTDNFTRSQEVLEKFEQALKNDLNTSVALSLLDQELKYLDKYSNENKIKAHAESKSVVQTMLHLLGLNPFLRGYEEKSETIEHNKLKQTIIETQIAARNTARANKDWAESDRIRDELAEQGILLEDGPKGTTWRRK